MKARCHDLEDPDYGGRGITYIPAWESFEVFLEDMGEAGEHLTIERLDNAQGYSKGNCRWATRSEQALNKRNVILYEYQGQKDSVAGWARRMGIQRLTLWYRLKAGWSLERALTEKP